MKIDLSQSSYTLVDSGQLRKLEKFGPYLIDRPCAQAVWQPQLQQNEWSKADAAFTREGESRWLKKRQLPESWTISVSDLLFKISPTDFGHLGIFPEQRDFWRWIEETIRQAIVKGRSSINVLNLFAYSGGATLAAAKGGAHVCHLDASKGMVSWARENAALNQLDRAPIRWIVDDVNKFLNRELKRNVRYDAIILDPPSFGRGNRGEVFKIEEDLPGILNSCKALLSENPLFVLFSCHTPGFTPLSMHHLLSQLMRESKGTVDAGEMILQGENPYILSLPSGVYARWSHA